MKPLFAKSSFGILLRYLCFLVLLLSLTSCGISSPRHVYITGKENAWDMPRDEIEKAGIQVVDSAAEATSILGRVPAYGSSVWIDRSVANEIDWSALRPYLEGNVMFVGINVDFTAIEQGLKYSFSFARPPEPPSPSLGEPVAYEAYWHNNRKIKSMSDGYVVKFATPAQLLENIRARTNPE